MGPITGSQPTDGQLLDPLAHFEPYLHGAIITCVGQPAAWLGPDDAPEPPGHFGPAARCPGLEVEPDWDGLGPVHELWTALRGGAANAAAPRPRPDDLGARMAMTEEHQATGSHAGRMPAQWHAASFKPVPRSVREARQFVGSLLEDPFLRETSELLVSELTTNALQHAVGEFEVRVRAEPRVRVEVCDRSSLPPIPKDLAPSDESGRGLHIVTRLATSWGTRELPEGKVVWFEL